MSEVKEIQSVSKQPDVLSKQYIEASKLHQHIIASAELAQQNLFEMCTGLKTMRDNKLYRELGYSNFEDYCENEVGIKRRNAYNYISIIEKINPENVQSIAHFGMTKLSLLATISEQEQQEISEKINLESTTVKQLKAEIEKLKSEKASKQIELSEAKRNASSAQVRLHETSVELERKCKKCEELSDRLDDANEQIKELENRPIEVAVQESSDNERRLQETLKALERENIKHYDELEKQYREDEQAVRQMLEKEKQEALLKQREAYEEKLNSLQADNNGGDDKDIFKAYFSIAYDSFNRMLEFAKHSKDKDFFKSKVKNLIEALTTQNSNL